MKAALIHENGPPEALRYEDVEPLPVGPRDAMIKVRATSVNWFDVMGRSGEYSAFKNFPHILGGDIAGEVVEVGSEVTNAKPGDRVLVYATVACGQCEYCLIGQPNICQHYKYYGSGVWGGYAQYFTGRAANLIQLDEGLDFGECASINVAFLTAWHMLQRADIRAGEDILIQAAASGVGAGAVQMAKLAGLRVIGTAGSDEKVEICRALGADVVIAYRRQDIGDGIRAAAPDGVDVFWETRRTPDFDLAVDTMAECGRMVLMAGRDARPPFPVGPFYLKQCTLHGTAMLKASAADQRVCAEDISQWLASGALRPRVDRILHLSDAAEAHALQERSTVGGENALSGKIVLVI